VGRWVASVGLDPRKFATRSIAPDEGDPDLPPHGELASDSAFTRPHADRKHRSYLGVEVDDSLEIAEKIERLKCRGRAAVLCP
jgi:hypothetical protein